MAGKKRQSDSGKASGSGQRVQGEGDYEATRRYDRDVQNFVATADIEAAARAAAPRNAREAAEMAAAERAGRRRAKLPARKKAVLKGPVRRAPARKKAKKAARKK
jgi:hypothetical protein